MKYRVQYTVNCMPMMQVLKSKKEVDKFLNQFIKKYKSLDDSNAGNWVSHIFYGKELSVDGTYKWYAKAKDL